MPQREALGGTLVIGGGFAGAYVAKLLGRHGATIVSPENFMLYTPILPEAASGTLEPRHVVVPIRQMCRRSELLLGRATTIDTDARTVTVQADDATFEIRYRELVVALGAVSGHCPSRASPSTGSASRASPTRFTSATTCCRSSSARWRGPT